MTALPSQLAQSGKDSITEYLPLVHRLAKRLARRLPSHVRIEDLVGAGVVGLLEAERRYEPGRNASFKSYAEFRVKGAMLDELRRRDLMARDARTQSKRISDAIAELSKSLCRPPEEEEIAEHLAMSVDELRRKLEKLVPVRVMSVDDARGWETSGERSPLDHAERNELMGHLYEAIEGLKERHQQILRCYYVEGMTLKQIGHVLGVTESRVCQLLSEVTLRLRTALMEKRGDLHV